MQYCPEKSWYVIRVRSQFERLVHLGLYHKNFESLNPSYKELSVRKDRRKILNRPIYKGYMFVRARLNPERHLEILKTPGVIEILTSAGGPAPVPDEQVENVRLLEKYVGVCFFSENFTVGDSVFVREGPLTGLRGVINRLDSKRIHINVDSIPGSVMIEVEPQFVQIEKDSIYDLVTKRL